VRSSSSSSSGSSQLVIKNEITTAKVPILILSSELGHTIDVSINNELPIFNTALLRTYASIDPRVRILVLCVKRWARLAGVTDAKSCNLSSYSWVLLVIYYLQVRHTLASTSLRDKPTQSQLLPSLQEMALSSKLSSPEAWFRDPSSGRDFDIRCVANDLIMQRLVVLCSREAVKCKATPSDLLKGFFTFYANEFQWGHEVVSIRTAQRLPITNHKFHSLSRGGRFPQSSQSVASIIHIEDPFDLQRNLNCVLDEVGVLRLRAAFLDVARRVATDVPYVLLLQQARLLFYGRQILPTRGFYVETDLASQQNSRRVDLW
jgi:terminal uridylyltransferase